MPCEAARQLAKNIAGTSWMKSLHRLRNREDSPHPIRSLCLGSHHDKHK